MGRTGISQEQVNAVADRIADTEGMGAVSLRRVRRELGSGSLQTIHRLLASWKAVADLKKPLPVADEVLPVRFIHPDTALDLSKVSLIGSLDQPGRADFQTCRRYEREVRCPGGQPPEGVVLINPPDFRAIAEAVGIPYARGVWYQYQGTDYKHQKKYEKHDLGWAVEASHGEHINTISDEIAKRRGPMIGQKKKAIFPDDAWPSKLDIINISNEIRKERAEICIKLDRALYDRLMARSNPVSFLAQKIEAAIIDN
ncbi:MAG: DNA-binding protein [Rhodospirillaceae bacterium]